MCFLKIRGNRIRIGIVFKRKELKISKTKTNQRSFSFDKKRGFLNIIIIIIKRYSLGIGSLALWLRALDAPAEEWGSVPTVTWWLTAICNCSSRRPNSLSYPQSPGTYTVHLHTCRQNTHIHKICKTNKNKTTKNFNIKISRHKMKNGVSTHLRVRCRLGCQRGWERTW